jgi:hypothetical protein
VDLVTAAMHRDIDEAYFPVDNAPIATMARCALSVDYEAVAVDDGEELSECALQAGQGTSKLA